MSSTPARRVLDLLSRRPRLRPEAALARLLTVAAALAALGALLVLPSPAAAQSYAEEPTGGVHLPAVALAGEHDAFATAVNPAGLRFLRGRQAALSAGVYDLSHPSSAGRGLGLFAGDTFGGGLLPLQGIGLGFELLSPGDVLAPDTGTPARFTLAYALSLGRELGVGVAWHHFFDDPDEITDGIDSFDLGASLRIGAYFAAGAVIRDLNSPVVAGELVERRYELELVTRPLGTERLDLGLGARLGERSKDLDAWLRGQLKIVDGVYLGAQLESRALTLLDEAMPEATSSERDLRVSLGLEVSFGSVNSAFYATAASQPGGSFAARGGSVRLSVGTPRIPSVLGRERRIEQVALAGRLDTRKLARALVQLRLLARDDSVAGVFVQIADPVEGWAQAEELRGALGELRRAGKKVYAYLVSGSMRDYFIATGADKIYLDPAGGLDFVGLSATSLYLGEALERAGVAAEFEKIEEYKSAPETFTQDGPSEAALRMRNELYDSVFAELVTRIAEARKLDADTVEALIDEGPYTAEALQRGTAALLVDEVVTLEDVGARVFADVGAILPLAAAPRERPEAWAQPAVAVIALEGDIVAGPSAGLPLLGRRVAGSETLVQAIAWARHNPRIQAIVLRIDSPGGSAVASALIAREVFKTRGVKPIVCSLGNAAASGGYYAAAGCDQIFAEATTITGSIGVFSGKFDISGLLTRLGVSWQLYERGAHASMNSMLRPFTTEERALLENQLRDSYERFIDTVASGRNMTPDQVDEIGRGRVWTGQQAKAVGLVDDIGGLLDALSAAKHRAGLLPEQRVELVWLPEEPRGLARWLMQQVGASAGGRDSFAAAALAWPPALRALREHLPASLWVEPEAVQARLPFTLGW